MNRYKYDGRFLLKKKPSIKSHSLQLVQLLHCSSSPIFIFFDTNLVMEAQEFREAAKAAIDESKSLYRNHNSYHDSPRATMNPD